MLLTTLKGQCIRFPVTDVRVFKGRDSMGVRGIALGAGDRVIALSILRHADVDAGERLAYLKIGAPSPASRRSRQRRRWPTRSRRKGASRRRAALQPVAGALRRTVALEQEILTISGNGYGKRTSSFEYRVTGRGGKGIVAMAINARNGKLVASFPVETATA